MRLSPTVPLALAGLASAVLAAPAAAAPADVNVGQGGDKFAPADVTVNVGDAVTWHWVSGTHNVHWTSNPGGAQDSAFLSKGGTFAQTFTTTGTYSYVCEAHSGMKGTVTVVAAPAPAPAPAPGPAPTDGAPQPVTGDQPTPATNAPAVDAAAPTLGRVTFRRSALRLRLSEPARLVIRYVRLGTRAHVVGKRTVRARTGLNAISVRRWMHAGRYRVSIVAVDAAGNASRPARIKLTVRR
jgi:plastocyanin